MKIAVFSDRHGNYMALQECIDYLKINEFAIRRQVCVHVKYVSG